MARDYYEILGVHRTATADEIRKAHRKLARKFHPDVNKAADAAAKFAEVQEAYDALSDPDKRKRYDQFGHAGVNGAAAGAGGDPFAGAGMGGGPFRQGPFKGTWSGGDSPGFGDIDQDTMDSIFGDLFGSRRSGRGGGRGGQQRPAPQVGEDIEHTLQVPFAVAAFGGSESLHVTAPDGSRQSIDLKIPPGVKSGAKLRVKGKGQPGRGGAPTGDLIITVQVGEHPWFRREGLDLYLDVPISIVEAALGAVIEVPLLRGTVKLKVPPGTSSGAKLRAKGKGIADSKNETGDFYAVIRVMAPESLSPDDRALLERLGQHLPNPRESTAWSGELKS